MTRTVRIRVEPTPAQDRFLRASTRVVGFSGGVGAGKTFVGALRCGMESPGARILVVGLTYRHLLDVVVPTMQAIYGDAMELHRSDMIVRLPGDRLLWLRSADAIERVRGINASAIWWDEVAYMPLRAITVAMGRARIGRPRMWWTTTPRRPSAAYDMWIADTPTDVTVVRAPSSSNPHLDPEYVDGLSRTYTAALAAQELEGEWVTGDGALWRRKWIEDRRVVDAPRLIQVVVGVDPAVSAGGDETGIVVVGRCADGHAYVIDDRSGQYAVHEWPSVVTGLAHEYGARVVAEVNQGGDLVERAIRVSDAAVPYEAVRASRGKAIRAEPIVQAYAAGRVHHAGTYRQLEAQMCGWDPSESTRSPDRIDALVWACTALDLAGVSASRGGGSRPSMPVARRRSVVI